MITIKPCGVECGVEYGNSFVNPRCLEVAITVCVCLRVNYTVEYKKDSRTKLVHKIDYNNSIIKLSTSNQVQQ